ncbi:response regulator [Trinickia dinghuensis]|uniref:Response regulator n=1 Tax=Trinickia dinghuensis TaxID=2291023 RepID=A0A3D8K573_9BURK|nr:response regulator [Trinickia dinghuensis]RDV00469.1 response regulator [Trinickia dinghuensis]
MRVLIAEAEERVAHNMKAALRHAGYAVNRVSSGLVADTVLAAETFDLLILDLDLPGMPSVQVLNRLRARNTRLPVLVLSRTCDVEAKVRVLDLGADDHMPKPFALKELMARARALIRRGRCGRPSAIERGALSFDQVDRCVTLHGRPLKLSAGEIGLLEILIQRNGRLVSKQQLIDLLYGRDRSVGQNAVDVSVHRLRAKIRASGVCITTMRGVGYFLENTKSSTVAVPR